MGNLKLSIRVCQIDNFVVYLFFSKCKLRLCSVSYMLMLCKCNLRYALQGTRAPWAGGVRYDVP